MNIKEVIAVLNDMQAGHVFERYAIGGAVGAVFYLEPFGTLDVDVFVTFEAAPTGLLVTLDPIYSYLAARGCIAEREYIIVAGTPVQFLPPGSPLVEEALRDAVESDVDGVPARVFTAEHLAAIALQTGRGKDKARLVQFFEEGAIDGPRFQQIVNRHNLIERWQQFERLYLDEEL